jgi:hypothetical protein
LPAAMAHFDWSAMAPQYDEVLENLTD